MDNTHAAKPKKFNIDFDKFEQLAKEIQDFTRKEEGYLEQRENFSQNDNRS